MRPTLAQRVWPRTTPWVWAPARARASSRSSDSARRSTLVLSPSSPISAATLTTKSSPPAERRRTLPDLRRGSPIRPSAPPRSSRPWFQRATWRPAESRPRTSRRSIAASACWTESSTARPASPGGSVVEARDVTPVHAPRRSREIDQMTSRIRTSAALASSGSPADSASRPSTAASCSGKT